MVRSRNRETVSLSNPQISIKLLSKAAAIFRAQEHRMWRVKKRVELKNVQERVALSVAPSGVESQLHPFIPLFCVRACVRVCLCVCMHAQLRLSHCYALIIKVLFFLVKKLHPFFFFISVKY